MFGISSSEAFLSKRVSVLRSSIGEVEAPGMLWKLAWNYCKRKKMCYTSSIFRIVGDVLFEL